MNKKLLAACSFSLFCASLSAQLGGNGYYRVQNDVTERYITIVDNRGSIDVASTTADLGALKTVRPFNEVVCDPGTIIYVEAKTGNEYNLKGQGTDAYEIIKHYLKISKVSGATTYRAYQEKGPTRSYLNDAKTSSDYGMVLTNDSRTRDWRIIPVDANSDCYFGVRPTVTDGTTHYASFFAGFPFNTASTGMKVLYIDRIVKDQAVYKEVSGTVPASTPVIVVCSSDDPSDNRLDVVVNAAKAPTDNLLKGVYFDNDNRIHYNRVAYDPATMRVLGRLSDGSVGFITATDLEFIPANQMYLQVPAGTPAELRLVDNNHVDAISAAKADAANDNVYTLDGRCVRIRATDLTGLPKGFYIFKGKTYRVD